MKYVARRDLKLGDNVVEAGSVFDTEDYGNRRWRSMLNRGDIDVPVRESPSIAPVEEEEAGVSSQEDRPSPSPTEEEPEPEPMPTRAELVDRLEAHGLTEDDVQGTGSNGYVTVGDLKETLDALDQ